MFKGIVKEVKVPEYTGCNFVYCGKSKKKKCCKKYKKKDKEHCKKCPIQA